MLIIDDILLLPPSILRHSPLQDAFVVLLNDYRITTGACSLRVCFAF